MNKAVCLDKHTHKLIHIYDNYYNVAMFIYVWTQKQYATHSLCPTYE